MMMIASMKLISLLMPSVATDTSLLTKTSRLVQHALARRIYCHFQSRWVFIATWHNVTYSSSSTSVLTHFELTIYFH